MEPYSITFYFMVDAMAETAHDDEDGSPCESYSEIKLKFDIPIESVDIEKERRHAIRTLAKVWDTDPNLVYSITRKEYEEITEGGEEIKIV